MYNEKDLNFYAKIGPKKCEFSSQNSCIFPTFIYLFITSKLCTNTSKVQTTLLLQILFLTLHSRYYATILQSRMEKNNNFLTCRTSLASYERSKIDRFRDDATSVNRRLRKLRFCFDLLAVPL